MPHRWSNGHASVINRQANRRTRSRRAERQSIVAMGLVGAPNLAAIKRSMVRLPWEV